MRARGESMTRPSIDAEIAAFREQAESLARDAAGDGCERDAAEWVRIAKLDDARVAYLTGCCGAVHRGLSSAECLEALSHFVDDTKSERDPKRRGPGAKTIALRAQVSDIVGAFTGSMSVRQVFYQLVSRGSVQNTGAAYESVSRLIVAMRRDGSIPYEQIVDRTRRVHKRAGWAGVREAMQSLASQYRRDPWDEQPVHVHIACEKQALEGVFSDVVDTYGAPLYVLRGFASEAFVFEWAVEIARAIDTGHRVIVAYFGDHDPSGLTIERDCRSRLARHVGDVGPALTWQRFGLLHGDLDRFGLVNVPVKRTDSRARSYLEEFGDRAAELDALPPAVLRDRILDAIAAHVDVEAWDRVRAIEAAESESLDVVAGSFERAVAAARAA